MTYKRRINVRGIIFKDGKLFAQTLKGDQSYWCTPGGGLDDGEPLLDGLRREMIEETGVTPQIGKLLFVQQFHDGAKEQLEFFFHITNASDFMAVDLAATSHGEREVAHCGFIDPQANNILPAMLQTADIQAYIDGDAPAQVTSEL